MEKTAAADEAETMEDETVIGKENAIERNFGPQPLDAVMTEHGLDNHALVALHGEGLTHKAMQRARKGRRLTPKMKVRITETLNKHFRQSGKELKFGVKQLFNY